MSAPRKPRRYLLTEGGRVDITECGSAFCSVVRYTCPTCGGYYAWCLTHNRPGLANRCTCIGGDVAGP